MRKTSALACLACMILAGLARAELKETTLAKPIPVNVMLTQKSEKISGSVVKYDAEGCQIKTAKGERQIKWAELTPQSHYVLRTQLLERKTASDWLELAELAMKLDLRDSAKSAVANAFRIDPASKLKGDAILRTQVSAKVAPPGAANDVVAPKAEKYKKGTPEQHANAIAEARARGTDVAGKMKLKMADIESAHFIIFTDWDPREYEFLKSNCEAAYAAVSTQFDIPVKENIFIGKLPVFMFARQADFMRFASTLDGFPVQRTVGGYFTSMSDGTGHMVMWKPDIERYGSVKEAERRWAQTLTHEFTHAFISRYKTDRTIPRWLNEGLAEVIAHGQFPQPEAHQYAKMMAGQSFVFENLFDDRQMPGGSMYPVMQTMVEALIKENPKAFLAMFDDLKEGMEPEEALKKHYKAGYKDWEPAWRRYAKNLRD